MNSRVKNTSYILLVTLLSFTICLGLLNISYAEEKFEIDADIGFDGYVKPNELTPVRIEIKNNFKDIEGKIQLLLHDERNKKDFYTAYSKEINLAKNSTKIINMESVFYRNDLLYVRILDKNNNVVFRKMIKYLKMNRSDGMFMGILDENVDSLRYLSKAHNINYPKGSRESFFEIAELDDTIPENHRTLKTFQTIVINNYDSQKLNVKQREALKNWIEDGGLLLIGTGPNYQKTLSGLNDINFLEVKGTKEIIVKSISNEKSMKLIDADLKDGEKIVVDENKELKLYHKKIGKGHVVITGFDLGLSPFVNWNGKDKFINNVINRYLNNDVDHTQNYQRMRSHWFENIVSYLPQNLLPSVTSILIILVLFILLVGPINYFILKKIDKRELLWVTIPLIVVIFSGSIYMLGFKTRLRQPIANNVSIIKIDNETNKAGVYTKSGIMGFKNGDWDVAFDKNSEVLLNDRRNYDVLQRFADEEIVTEYFYDEDTHILFNKAGILDVEKITINQEIELDNSIISDIMISNDKLTGTIDNTSGFDLEDVVIFYGNKYEKLGDLKDGEKSKKFQVNINKHQTNKNWYGIIDSLYGGRYQNNSQRTKNEGEDILNSNIKRDILDGIFDSKNSLIGNDRFFMLAWNRDAIGKNIKINGKQSKSIDRNLILLPLDIEYKKGDKVNIPYGVLYPEIENNHNMHLERKGSMLYGEGHVTFRFKPEEDVRLTSMGISLAIDMNKNDVFIYNFEKTEWENISTNKIIIDNTNMVKYYNNDRGALVKIDPKEDIDILIPSFEIKGVKE